MQATKGRVSFARRQLDELHRAPAPVPEGRPHNTAAAIAAYRRPLKASELAPLLGMSDDRLYAMTRRGDIPRLIVPGSSLTRYDPATICAWLIKHNPILRQLAKAS